MPVRRRFLLQIAMIAAATVAVEGVVARLSDPAVPADAPAPGRLENGRLSFERAPVAAVLEGVRRRTGFQVVTFPQIADMSYSGTIVIEAGGAAAVRQLGRQLGLALCKGGPHWVLVPASRGCGQEHGGR